MIEMRGEVEVRGIHILSFGILCTRFLLMCIPPVYLCGIFVYFVPRFGSKGILKLKRKPILKLKRKLKTAPLCGDTHT